MDVPITRRRLLLAGGATAVGGLAGCLAVQEIDGEGDRVFVITIAPVGEPRFEPDEIEIQPGHTIEFEWGANGYTLVIVSQPDGANLEGEDEPQEAGHSVSYEFDVEGVYEFSSSSPDGESLSATVTVGEDAEPPDPDPGDDPIG